MSQTKLKHYSLISRENYSCTLSFDDKKDIIIQTDISEQVIGCCLS